MTLDLKNMTSDEKEAFEAGRNEAAEEREGVPRTVADIHNMSREDIITHKRAVDEILRTQPGISKREARRINAEADE